MDSFAVEFIQRRPGWAPTDEGTAPGTVACITGHSAQEARLATMITPRALVSTPIPIAIDPKLIPPGHAPPTRKPKATTSMAMPRLRSEEVFICVLAQAGSLL